MTLPRLPELMHLTAEERGAFLHCIGEAQRVESAVSALHANEIETFGRLLSASHESLRDQLRVSNAALDELVDCALACGALGARLTGTGFGGCAISVTRVQILAYKTNTADPVVTFPLKRC